MLEPAAPLLAGVLPLFDAPLLLPVLVLVLGLSGALLAPFCSLPLFVGAGALPLVFVEPVAPLLGVFAPG